MSIVPEHDGTVLADLIDQKLQLLVELGEAARRQLELIEADQVTALVTLLTAKQQRVQQLDTLQQALAPHREVAPEARRWPNPEARRRCREAARRCDAALEELLALERQCEATLLARRGRLADQLQQTECSAQAMRAYAAPGPPTSGGRLDIAVGD